TDGSGPSLASADARVPALDGVRGLAIALVLVAHGQWLVGPAGLDPSSLDRHVVLGILDFMGISGGLGVELFFVLSGYLITGILADTRDRPGYFSTFYTRRALRIFPLYLVAL